MFWDKLRLGKHLDLAKFMSCVFFFTYSYVLFVDILFINFRMCVNITTCVCNNIGCLCMCFICYN